MKTKLQYFSIVLALLAVTHQAAAQGTTAFAYQGQLGDGGTNANESRLFWLVIGTFFAKVPSSAR